MSRKLVTLQILFKKYLTQLAFMFNKNSQFFSIKQMNITITTFPVLMRKYSINKPVNNFVNFADHKH